jgi:hypothetical protein
VKPAEDSLPLHGERLELDPKPARERQHSWRRHIVGLTVPDAEREPDNRDR